MGYICKSDNPDYELVDLIRKTFIPGEYMLVMLVDDQIIICGLDTRNPKLIVWEYDFYEGERYIELRAVYSADAMMQGKAAFNLMEGGDLCEDPETK